MSRGGGGPVLGVRGQASRSRSQESLPCLPGLDIPQVERSTEGAERQFTRQVRAARKRDDSSIKRSWAGKSSCWEPESPGQTLPPRAQDLSLALSLSDMAYAWMSVVSTKHLLGHGMNVLPEKVR